MKKNIDLLHGRILRSLTGLAFPIMATPLVQAAYNLTGTAWIGTAGSGAVAAVEAATTYTWLSSDMITLARTGGQVKSTHAHSEGDLVKVVQYGKDALQLALGLVIAYGALANMLADPLIGSFHLNPPMVMENAILYLRVACGPVVFVSAGQTLTGLYTISDNSGTPFTASHIGVGANIVLDPLLIFGLGPVPGLRVVDAAITTVFAQFIVVLVLILAMRRDPALAAQMRIWNPTPLPNTKTVIRIGFPSSVQDMPHYGISMVLTRLVTSWGDAAAAVQRVGRQIESIPWMTADDFGSTINAFVGQNYGTGNLKRAKEGCMAAASIMFVWGIFTACLLTLGVVLIFSLSTHEAEVTSAGADHLRTIGFSEMFMCVGLMTVGAMSGMGKIMEASVITIIFTAIRIPLTILLGGTVMELNGIWRALTISSIVKGIISFTAFMRMMRKWNSHIV